MGAARYEFSEGSSNKFWEIELSGSSFTTKHGKIGTPGSSLTKDWPDAATAKKEHDKLVAQKTKKGYSLVSSGTPAKASKGKAAAAPAKAEKPAKAAKGAKGAKAAPASGGHFNAQLAKQIDANPDDEGAWSVYADWLQGQGDPRGELGVVQERLRSSPKDKALASAEKKLLKDNRETLFDGFLHLVKRKGSLGSVLNKPDIEPDFRQTDESASPVRILWRSGFFQQVFAGHPGYDWDGPGGGDDGDHDTDELVPGATFMAGSGEVDMPKLVGEILSHPSARFLTSLRLGMPNSMDDGECDFDQMMKVLAKHEALTRLRSLYIGDITQEESECSWINIGDVSKLYPKLKNLRHLTLRGGSDLKLGKIELPDLRSLTIITGGLDKKNVASICAAKWPKLEKLELWFGSKSYGGNATVKDVAPLLTGKAFPKLKQLGLRNCEFVDDLAAQIPTSPLMKQVESLDLSKGTMTESGVKALVDGKASLAHLRRLDLSDNYLGKASTLAGSIIAAVRTRPQRTADEWDGVQHRYVALGE